jgi:hypothetical protein
VPVHAFLDENKERRLTVVVAIVAPEDLATCRRSMSGLVLPGQNRVHFTKERDSRRGQILNVICGLPLVADVYQSSPETSARQARPETLRMVIRDLASQQASRLVIEQDDSVFTTDKAVLYQAVRQAGVKDLLRYDHLRPQSEPLLWVPDAIAWCLARGGSWLTRVQPVISSVIDV